MKKRKVLLLCSYCDDNPDCTDNLPCIECLKMCNIAECMIEEIKVIGGYDYMKETKKMKVVKRRTDDGLIELKDETTIPKEIMILKYTARDQRMFNTVHNKYHTKRIVDTVEGGWYPIELLEEIE